MSSIVFSGPVYHEYCDCSQSDVTAWQRIMQCPEEDPQIQADFGPFPSIDLLRLSREVPQRFAKRGGLIHYTVLNNQVHRRSLGKYTDFKMFSDEILLSLARKVRYSFSLRNQKLNSLLQIRYFINTFLLFLSQPG